MHPQQRRIGPFAAPNTTGIMHSVPTRQRDAASDVVVEAITRNNAMRAQVRGS